MVRLEFECREQGGELVATILQEGRASSGGLAEVFAPGSVRWPADGVEILCEHRGKAETTAFPHRDALGRIEIRAKATDAIRQAIAAGKNKMSVEFKALDQRRTPAGIREILSAYVDRAALVSAAEYDTTRAEIRSRAAGKRRLPRWL